MAGIARSLLDELVSFLKIFKDASDELEASKSVTLHMVVPWYYRLQQHCRIHTADSEAMKKVKVKAGALIVGKFKVARLHLLATALNPKMKGLKMLADDEKQAVYEDLRQRVQAVGSASAVSGT